MDFVGLSTNSCSFPLYKSTKEKTMFCESVGGDGGGFLFTGLVAKGEYHFFSPPKLKKM